ncbi:hypothetical protein Patl1_20487 [Pistacia atlantica]|uniref:Uncharacterized protein n=1 Tax=Pistacia atlantica TaxID=434234 RepID=A0ACC1BM97_9ROSI|nr:hypothetical protein Patl1_20487 [Pistacia atlantica]
MRTYRNARGEVCVFNVELTDQDEMYGLSICSRNIRIGAADGFGDCVGMVNSCWELPNIVLAGAIAGAAFFCWFCGYAVRVKALWLVKGLAIGHTNSSKNEAARKFYDRCQLGKVYYISRGTLRLVRELAEKEPDNGVFKMLRCDVTRILTTILIGTTVANIGATALVTEVATALFGEASVRAATGVMTVSLGSCYY